MDSANRIYVADTVNFRIVRMDDMTGAGWTTFGARGSGVGQFMSPFSVFVARDGHIYIADDEQSVSRIVRMDDMTGAGWITFGSTSIFSSPTRTVVGGDSRIYVVDSLGVKIVRINDMTGAGATVFGSSGNGIGQFSLPFGIFVN